MHVQKLLRKAVKIASKAIPNNPLLRPKGYYVTPKEYYEAQPCQGIFYQEIYPNHTTTLKLPDTYSNLLPDYIRFDDWSDPKKEYLTATTNTYVVGIPGGRLFTNNQDLIAFISSDNQLIGDVSYQWSKDEGVRPQNNSIFNYLYFPDIKHLPGVALSLLAGGHSGESYAHWMTDVLPKIHLVKAAGLFDVVDWFIVPSFAYEYQRESLGMLGIPADKVIVSNKPINHYQADLLLATAYIRGQRSHLVPDWVHTFLQETFLPHILEEPNPYPAYVYINRRGYDHRHILNEAELITLLSIYGIESFSPAEMKLKQCLQLFQAAKVIVGVSGDDLTNLAFCKPGTQLIELAPDVFPSYVWLNYSRYSSVKHDTLFCKSTASDTDMKWNIAEKQNFHVNILLLKSKLEKIFSTRNKHSWLKKKISSVNGHGATAILNEKEKTL